MPETRSVTTLKRKRSEIVASIRMSAKKVAQARAHLAHVAAAIRIFQASDRPHDLVTFSLTLRHCFSYLMNYLALCRAPFRTACRKQRRRGAVPAGGIANPHPGGFGSPVNRQKDRSARSVLNRGIFGRSGQNSR